MINQRLLLPEQPGTIHMMLGPDIPRTIRDVKIDIFFNKNAR